VTNRKKNILLAQILIFITASLIIYYTYGNKVKMNDSEISDFKVKEKKEDSNNQETKSGSSNTFENVKYKGVDLRGNRYEIKSEIADFDIKTPELINMRVMSAIFYFKDGTILKIRGDYGTYNNKTNDMKFRDNIKAEYINDYLFADNLDFLNSKNSLTIYGNVRAESIEGNIIADKLDFDLLEQTLNLSMFDEKQVNVQLNKK
tara:strand:- start:5 stop:616 length:612 start_codon:yes stop_codon:yes gene_type:complete